MIEENELARLEGFVATLLEKFNTLQAEKKDLIAQLGRRDATIVTLEDDLVSMKSERGEISTRVSSLIGKIEDWESDSEISMDDSEDASTDSGVQGNLFATENPDE